jgi:hypothetical protein
MILFMSFVMKNITIEVKISPLVRDADLASGLGCSRTPIHS